MKNETNLGESFDREKAKQDEKMEVKVAYCVKCCARHPNDARCLDRPPHSHSGACL